VDYEGCFDDREHPQRPRRPAHLPPQRSPAIAGANGARAAETPLLRVGLFDGWRHRPLTGLCNVAKRYGGMIYVDEVHAVGLYGARAGGIAERDGVMQRAIVINSQTRQGLWHDRWLVAGSAALIDFLRSDAQFERYSAYLGI